MSDWPPRGRRSGRASRIGSGRPSTCCVCDASARIRYVSVFALICGSPTASELIVDAARAVGGGGNPKAADIGVAGGKDPSKIDDLLAAARQAVGAVLGQTG